MAKSKESKKLPQKEVIIRVETKETRSLDQLSKMKFQGKFKHLPEENFQKLKNSICNNGFRIPIFIWRSSCLDGHQRIHVLEQMRQEGFIIPDLPVVELKAENETDARKLLLLINSRYGKISEQGFFEFAESLDVSDLAFEMEIPEIDLGIDGESNQTSGEDEIPEGAKTITKTGDIYELNGHRLICGSCEKLENLKRLVGEEEIEMVFTDPPYGVSIGDKNKMLNSFQKAGMNLRDIQNDSLSTDDLYKLLVTAFKNIHEIISNSCSVYVTAPQGGELGLMMMMMMQEANLKVRHILNWVKNSQTFSMGRLDYEYKHEPILYTWKKTHKFYGKGKFTNSVWEYDKPRKCDIHPTMKPVELVENAILNSTKEKAAVLDAFLGSGTTMIACQKTNRRCFGMELEPHYCDVIVKRFVEYCKANNMPFNIKRNGKPFKQEE